MADIPIAAMKAVAERLERVGLDYAFLGGSVNMAQKIRFGPAQLPEIHGILPPICERLGIVEPKFYLEMNPQPNAYVTCMKTCCYREVICFRAGRTGTARSFVFRLTESWSLPQKKLVWWGGSVLTRHASGSFKEFIRFRAETMSGRRVARQ